MLMHIPTCTRFAVPAALLALSVASLAPAARAQRPSFESACAAWQPQQVRAWMRLDDALACERLACQGPAPQSGEAVITEFMKDPATVADTRGEWVEIYNALPWRLNIEGWTISDDGGSSHVINAGGAGVRCRPGHYLVIGNNGDMSLNGGVHEDYTYSGFVLGNTSDQIILTRPGGGVVDRVAYDAVAPWPNGAGKSIALKIAARDAFANDDGANWCLSSTPISGTNPDTGTPSADNDACP
jgi:hypothetical protein